MSEFNSHLNITSRSADSPLPIVTKLTEAYQRWQEFLPHFPKTSRYALGSKIDSLYLEAIEAVVIAVRLSVAEKLPYLNQASIKLDLLKFFLKVAWQIKALDNKKYLVLSEDLDEIGRMLGGWLRELKKKLPGISREE